MEKAYSQDLIGLVKGYLKDEDCEPLVLDMCIQSAIVSINDAVDKKIVFDGRQSSLATLAVCYLATHYYENRAVYQSGKTMSDVPYTISSILFHLKYGDENNERGGNEPQGYTVQK